MNGMRSITFFTNLLSQQGKTDLPSILRIILVQLCSHNIDQSVQDQSILMSGTILNSKRCNKDKSKLAMVTEYLVSSRSVIEKWYAMDA